jgi:hypothetical protein
MFAMASRPPPKLQSNDSTSCLHLGWGLATSTGQPADSLGEGRAHHLGWSGRNSAAATNSGVASTPGGEVATGALEGNVHGLGIDTSGVAGANAPVCPNDGNGTSVVRFDSGISDAAGGKESGSSVGLSTERGSGANAAATTKQSQLDYVNVRVDINAADFVSVLARPRPGPCALDVLRALPAASSVADSNMLRAHGSMDSTTDGNALTGSTMAGWASVAGTRVLEAAKTEQQHDVSSSSATSLNINGVRDST